MLTRATRVEQTILAIVRARIAANRGMAVSHSVPLASEEQLVGQAVSAFMAALEVTAHTITWTLFLLSQHSAAQAAVLDELAFLRSEVPTLEQACRLRYLDQVVKESMRILPAVPMSHKIALTDTELGGYFIPKSSRIWFSHYVTHHLPELFVEPDVFRPERWDVAGGALPRYAPFGAAGSCVSTALAQYVVRATLATLLSRWRLTIVPNCRIDRQAVATLFPKYGLPVTVSTQDRQFESHPVRGNINEMVCLGRQAAPTLSASVPRRAA
jgi:cytochrome P450